MLRWAVTQQLGFALSRNGLVLPNAGHRPSFKAELLAASNYSQRRRHGKAKTSSRGQRHRSSYGRVDGALP